MLIPSHMIVRAMMVVEGKLPRKEFESLIEVRQPGPEVKLERRAYLGMALDGQSAAAHGSR